MPRLTTSKPIALAVERKLNGRSYQASAPPGCCADLTYGWHTLSASAVAAAGNTDACPAGQDWIAEIVGPAGAADPIGPKGRIDMDFITNKDDAFGQAVEIIPAQ